MRHLIWLVGLLVWLAAVPVLAATGEPAQQAPASSEAGKAGPRSGADITPEAAAPLRAMCELLASHKSFAFAAGIILEQVYPNGQNIELTRRVDVVLKRPDKLYARITGDDRDRVIVYDGKTVSVADLDKGVYAVLDAPGTIDATLTMLETQYGVLPPLADLLYAEPCRVLLEDVRTGDFVGRHFAGGKPCDHLAFTQKTVDWQIWIDPGTAPLPRKLVITDKEVMGWPRYAVRFTDWNFNPRLPANLFTFTPPKDAHKIGFLPLTAPKGATKPEGGHEAN